MRFGYDYDDIADCTIFEVDRECWRITDARSCVLCARLKTALEEPSKSLVPFLQLITVGRCGMARSALMQKDIRIYKNWVHQRCARWAGQRGDGSSAWGQVEDSGEGDSGKEGIPLRQLLPRQAAGSCATLGWTSM